MSEQGGKNAIEAALARGLDVYRAAAATNYPVARVIAVQNRMNKIAKEVDTDDD